MAVLSTTNPTLADVAKRYDADGKIDTIVELLAETNEVLEDMTFLEGNLPTGHKTTVRSGLPSSTWRKLNYGVQPSKSTTVQITDTTGMLEAYAEVDKALADLNGNTASFRLSEDRAFLESMNQTMANTLFYGDTGTDPEKFMGLSARYNSTSAESGDNIIVGGGSGSDNTSIWLVCWGPNTCHGIYPKGSQAGLKHHDLGEVTLEDAANGKYQGYRTHYKWDIGMSVRDWRYIVRIPNIDVSNLTKDASGSSAALVDLMVQAVEKLPNLNLGRCVFYGNRTVSSILRRQITNTSNVRLSMDEVAGKRVMAFDGIPFRRNDAILNDETLVS
jgi:hypothetical protein|tara:strand:+ start:1206 stop:2198 length:993 start_codon:yes stop_codon:yes gene_type:complete